MYIKYLHVFNTYIYILYSIHTYFPPPAGAGGDRWAETHCIEL